jgi:hypothetical protein
LFDPYLLNPAPDPVIAKSGSGFRFLTESGYGSRPSFY